MTFGIRPASPDDAAAIVSVARESWHAAYDPIIGAETVDAVIDEWYMDDRLAAFASEEDRPLYLATGGADGLPADGESAVAGFGQGHVLEDDPEGFRIARLYVRPPHWGDGIGTALLDRLLDEARELDASRVTLETFVDNDVGVSFYESRGFEVVDTRETEFGADEHVFEREI